MSSLDVYNYQYALVGRIPDSFAAKANTQIDLNLVHRQHNEFIETLRRIGIDVLELPADERHDEGVFVGDTAVVINGTALICKPADKRMGETSVVRSILRTDLGMRIVEVDNEKARLNGTDVLFTGKEIIVGISRSGNGTNKEGAQCVAKSFPEYAVTIVNLPENVRRLQQVMSVAGPDIVVVSRTKEGSDVLQEMITRATFSYRVIRVDEEQAANVIYANTIILHLDEPSIPNSFPIWEAKFDNRLALDVSEISRRGGFLTSLALLITKPSSYSQSFQTSLERGHHEL